MKSPARIPARLDSRENQICFGDFIMIACYEQAAQQVRKFRAECLKSLCYEQDTMKAFINFTEKLDKYHTFCDSKYIKVKGFRNKMTRYLETFMAVTELQLGATNFNLFGFADVPKDKQAVASRYNLALNIALCARSAMERGKEFGVTDKFYSPELEEAVIKIGETSCFADVPRASDVIVYNGRVLAENPDIANGLVIMIKKLTDIWKELLKDFKTEKR